MSDLKPCPHCGSDSIEYDASTDSILCEDCGMEGPCWMDATPGGVDGGPTRTDLAASLWNELPRRGDEWRDRAELRARIRELLALPLSVSGSMDDAREFASLLEVLREFAEEAPDA